VAKTEDDSVPLPDPFPLPKYYPNHLEEALSKGKMSHKQKQAFITEVASSMLRFKRYPTRDDYICVARSIVLKYPFFKQTTGRPYVRIGYIQNLHNIIMYSTTEIEFFLIPYA